MMSVGQGKAADQKRGQRNKCRERGIPQTVQNEILDTLKNKQTNKKCIIQLRIYTDLFLLSEAVGHKVRDLP